MSLLKSEPPVPSGRWKSCSPLRLPWSRRRRHDTPRSRARMRQEGDPALADVFERLSADEQGHLDNVVEWSERTKGGNPTPLDPMADAGDLRRRGRGDGQSAAAEGLSSALHGCTQRGARFRVLELCRRPCRVAEVRQAAETMAHEELGHVSILRRERRNAFHAERKSSDSSMAGGAFGSRRPRAAARRPARTPRGEGHRRRIVIGSPVSWKRRADMPSGSIRPQSTWP